MARTDFLPSQHIGLIRPGAGNDLQQGQVDNDQVVYRMNGGQDFALPGIEV